MFNNCTNRTTVPLNGRQGFSFFFFLSPHLHTERTVWMIWAPVPCTVALVSSLLSSWLLPSMSWVTDSVWGGAADDWWPEVWSLINKDTSLQANEQPGLCCTQDLMTLVVKNENHTLSSIASHCRHNVFMRSSTKQRFLVLYLYVCWQCAAECALPDRGVWPPPPRPPVVSSYSSSLSSGAFGSELKGKQVRGRRGRWKEARRFKSNY